MNIKKIFLILVTIISVPCFGQTKQVSPENQFWTQYSFWGRLSSKWSIYFDGVDRFNNFFKSENTIFLRPAIVYDLSSHVSVYGGYCYAISFPDENSPVNLGEHRPWQQLMINNKVGKFSFQHRYRLEERFNQVYKNNSIEDNYLFTWRFRYKLNIQYPIWKAKDEKKSLSILVSDEIITSFGKNVVVSYFNQNRLFIGFSFHINKSLSTSFGYTNIFRSTNTVGHYISIDAPTININQKLDFRKDKVK
jgi:hypothetical protein